jgi:hypothetical protein
LIKFLNESVRTEFHLLPVDRQQEFQESAAHFGAKGLKLTILMVERISEKVSEVAIRVDQQFDHPGSSI